MAITAEVGDYPSLNDTDQKEIVWPLANFAKDIWGDIFTSYTFDQQVYEMLVMETEPLKKEVRCLLMEARNERKIVKQLEFINTIERPGISYHFKDEIEQQLEEIFTTKPPKDCDDLTTTALQFRLLRQHGFPISCHIFDEFMDTNGKLKNSLGGDIKGLLSLYEAAQLRTKEDIILEDALAFATTSLKHAQATLPLTSSSIGQQVKRALELPLHKGHERTEVRYYISAYELEDDSLRNETLLKLAKLDFNLRQMLHKKELSELSRRRRDLKLISKHDYARDRMVECYFWALGICFEPQHSKCRILLAKTLEAISIIDDTYDAYGTLGELQIFTDAIQSWDLKEMDGLPDYMKSFYKALLDISEEAEKELANYKEPSSYAIHCYNDRCKDYCRSEYVEANWFQKQDLPTFDEYMKVGMVTSCVNLLVTAASVLMTKSTTKEVFDWLASAPKIMEPIMLVSRLLNDIASHHAEKERSATGVHCYMNNSNVSEEEAMVKLEEIVEDAWKDFNEEWIRPTHIPRDILNGFLGVARLCFVCYKRDLDGYTEPAKLLKPYIIATLVDPIVI